MKASACWSIVVRRRVSLGGCVTGPDVAPVRGGLMELSAQLDSVCIIAPIRHGGTYFFLDLPAGQFVLSGKDDRGRALEQRSVAIGAVATKDKQLDFNMKVKA